MDDRIMPGFAADQRILPDRALGGMTALVTAAGGDRGVALVRRLKAAGAGVIGVDRVAVAEADETIFADLGSVGDVTALGDAIAGRRIDILVHCADARRAGDRPTDRLWARYTNSLIAPAALSRAVVPGMRARGRGWIFIVATPPGGGLAGRFARRSPAGLKGLSKALQAELAGSGVTVVHVAPERSAIRGAGAAERLARRILGAIIDDRRGSGGDRTSRPDARHAVLFRRLLPISR